MVNKRNKKFQKKKKLHEVLNIRTKANKEIYKTYKNIVEKWKNLLKNIIIKINFLSAKVILKRHGVL